ncbi:DUF4232 domain-containing protein [Kocuria rhizophila]|nr:DUF4232 domain-containing protein [Kocuria rhizophila]
MSFVDAAEPSWAPPPPARSPAAQVTLQPGASTSTSVSIARSRRDGAGVQPARRRLRVYPPGSHESLSVVCPTRVRPLATPRSPSSQVKGFGS